MPSVPYFLPYRASGANPSSLNRHEDFRVGSMSVRCTAPQKQTSPLLLNPTIVNAPIRISRHGVGRPRAEDVSSRALLQNVAIGCQIVYEMSLCYHRVRS